MSKKDRSGSPVSSFLPILHCAAGLAVSAYAWAVFDPISFHAQLVPLAQRFLAGGAAGGALGAVLWWRPRRSPQPTWEDWACGHYVTGLPGSGKTAFAYLMIREFCRHGWGWIWLSIKSSLPLLQYLPAEARERCIVFAPYSDHPRGINLLKCYTGTATERELIADQVAELFDRLHPAMSGNMREMIRMGTLALLQWAETQGARQNRHPEKKGSTVGLDGSQSKNCNPEKRAEVTLWELYRFFQEEGFRAKILAGAPKPVRDAFSGDEARKTTLQAVRVQLRRAVASENLLVALSQRDGIDLWDVMVKEQWLVCDTPEAILGPAVASFLCQIIASRVQMLTARRPPGSRPFGCFADEFQEYSNPSFAKGIATGREFGLAWFLIHQSRANQGIGKEVAGAVHLCGSRWYFQQAPEDARAAVDATEGRWEPQDFTHLPKRNYRAMRRIQGRPDVLAGVTPDLPTPDEDLAGEIIQRAAAGPGRAEILAEIQKRKIGLAHLLENEVTAGDRENA